MPLNFGDSIHVYYNYAIGKGKQCSCNGFVVSSMLSLESWQRSNLIPFINFSWIVRMGTYT